MLPNHAPLMVAERFKVLEALFPGRIDLGLGRAPGTDPVTSYALRRRQDTGDDDFLERFQELMLFESSALPGRPSVPQRSAPCRPTSRCRRSGCSARATTARSSPPWSAPAIRSPIISPTTIRLGPMLAYRDQFKPSATRDKPYAILACAAVCADTDAEAERLASTIDLNFVRRRRGEYLPLASPEEAVRAIPTRPPSAD